KRGARAVIGYSPGGGARLVAGGEELRASDRADPGLPLLRAESTRSKPRAVGWIHGGGGRRAHIFRRRQRVCAILPRHPAAARSDRSGPAPDRRLRAAVVHASRSHESSGG